MEPDARLPVEGKLRKISDMLTSLVDPTPAAAWCDKENGCSDSKTVLRTQPENLEAYYSRVSSFQPGLWNVLEISPLECARWGWKVLEKGIIQCVTCREVVGTILPDPSNRDAYSRFLQLLKDRLRDSHKEACGWRNNPSPEELTLPPSVSTIEELRNLRNSARTLSDLNSALPYLHNLALMKTLEVDEELMKGLMTSSSVDEVLKSSVLLVLCGWSRGQGAYLRCRVCRRSIGLWSFFTRADELQNNKEITCTLTEPHLVKEKKSSHETDDLSSSWSKRLRGNRTSEEKLNKQDETLECKKQKKREGTRKSDNIQTDESLQERKEDSSLLIIGSPATQIKKVDEKQYFNPLQEHRHWCTWLMDIQDDISNGEENHAGKKGYRIVAERVKSMISLSNRKDLCSSEKYAKNVEGIRLIRSMLNDLSEEI